MRRGVILLGCLLLASTLLACANYPQSSQGRARFPRVSGSGDKAIRKGKRQKQESEIVIVIDPGHGGSEEGAHGVDGILEKEVVLNISMFVEERLRKELGATVVLTRARDQDVALADRTKIANDESADLFVSIHTNASVPKTLSGIETYFLDNTNDKASLKLAERENAVAGKPVSDLSLIVSDLVQTVKIDDSVSLAHRLHTALLANLRQANPNIKDLGVKRAPFYVLVGAHMPCALVEVSFIDHPQEGKLLSTREYQKRAADGVFEGIREFLKGKGRLPFSDSPSDLKRAQ